MSGRDPCPVLPSRTAFGRMVAALGGGTRGRQVVAAFAEALLTELKTSGEVLIPGMGRFTVRRRKARRVRHPAAHEVMVHVPETLAVRFRACEDWKAALGRACERGEPT